MLDKKILLNTADDLKQKMKLDRLQAWAINQQMAVPAAAAAVLEVGLSTIRVAVAGGQGQVCWVIEEGCLMRGDKRGRLATAS